MVGRRIPQKQDTDVEDSAILRYRKTYELSTLAALQEQEKTAIQKALNAASRILERPRGIFSLAARLLGIDRSRLRRKIALHDIAIDPSEDDVI